LKENEYQICPNALNIVIAKIWSEAQGGHTPSEKWQAKIRRVRQFLRGWAKNISATNKREKSQLLDKLNMLDKKAENSPLDQDELNLKHVMNERLADLLREEELKWYQRAKAKNLLEGDANTKYFHLVANGKYRKSRIF
jgi:mannosylglycoprotein endo-beta-mannosidase